jgi:hypothetical protein
MELAVEFQTKDESKVFDHNDVLYVHEIIRNRAFEFCPSFINKSAPMMTGPANVRVYFYFNGVYINRSGRITSDKSLIKWSGISEQADNRPFAWSSLRVSYRKGIDPNSNELYYVTGNDNVQRQITFGATMGSFGRGFTPAEGSRRFANYLREAGSVAGIRQFWARGGFFLPIGAASADASITPSPAASASPASTVESLNLTEMLLREKGSWYMLLQHSKLKVIFTGSSSKYPDFADFGCERDDRQDKPTTCWGRLNRKTGAVMLHNLTTEAGGNKCVLRLDAQYQLETSGSGDKPIWRGSRRAEECQVVDCYVGTCTSGDRETSIAAFLVHGDKSASALYGSLQQHSGPKSGVVATSHPRLKDSGFVARQKQLSADRFSNIRDTSRENRQLAEKLEREAAAHNQCSSACLTAHVTGGNIMSREALKWRCVSACPPMPPNQVRSASLEQ